MNRLIVISNRVNPPADPGVGTTGGLAMALSAALREYQGVWFGWSGQTTPEFTGQLSMQKIGGVTVALVDLEEQDRLEYYNGFANKTLWPLFHYRTDLTSYERAFSEGYQRVNARFAETVLPLLDPDDLIWIQDYHLIPLAAELRKRGVKNRIGFFLHIPWPARRVFTTLPLHRDLVETLFAYDLVGFQTDDSYQAFAEYVTEELSGSVSEDGAVSAFGKTTRIGAFPIGIDAADFIDAAGSERAKSVRERMRASIAGRQVLVGADRLDYSKGLEERFLAYEQLLTDSPELQERLFMLQIASPSRNEVETYREIRTKLDSVSGRINGTFATYDWVPLRYVNRAYRRDELAGLFASADVGVVTPLRDGMNLVAKEFVAAQDAADPGVLVLSQFAGAAEQMKEALIVNPFSREDMADAMRRGLAMPLKERISRWESLIDGVRANDVTAWRDAFVSRLRSDV